MDIIDTINFYLPPKRKTTPSGWSKFNCPACIRAGELRPDTRQRAGLRYTPTGGISYHCFNCGTKAVWEPGSLISNKMAFVLQCLNIPYDIIRKIKFHAWKTQNHDQGTVEIDQKIIKVQFPTVQLPADAKPFSTWISMAEPPEKFIKAAEYINNRGEHFLNAYNYYWSSARNLQNRVIIPFYWNDNCVGWVGRLFDGTGAKYYGEIPTNYLFNYQVMEKTDRKYLIVVEGIFDALAIDALGAMRNGLSENQIAWINSSGLEVIVCPDRNKAGNALVNIALSEGWAVSEPEWETDVDDVSRASQKYGRIYTLRSIIASRETNHLKIKMRRKKFQ